MEGKEFTKQLKEVYSSSGIFSITKINHEVNSPLIDVVDFNLNNLVNLRIVYRGGASFELEKIYIGLDKEDYRLQEKGVSKVIMQLLKGFCDRNKFDSVEVEACEKGAYFFAKIGFLPDQESWLKLRQDIEDNLDVNTKNYDKIINLLSSTDPAKIREIVKLENGREILVGQEWKGCLDFKNDKEGLKMFNDYISIKPNELNAVKSILQRKFLVEIV